MKWLWPAAALLVASCVPANEFAYSDDAKTACEAEGSAYVSDPMIGGFSCVERSSDAGKTCNRASECEGFCEVVSEGAPGQCSAVTQIVFGCVDFYDDEGDVVSICI